MVQLAVIHEQLMKILIDASACYACPLSSEMIGHALNVTPSYIREQAQVLQRMDLIGVRRGRGGGYFLRDRSGKMFSGRLQMAAGQ